MAEIIPVPGTIWRSKRNGRIVRVTGVSGPLGNFHTVEWEALTGRGPKTGGRASLYWGDVFEPAGTPTEDELIVLRFTQLSSTAIRRIIEAGESIITERANDGVMG